MQESPSHDRHNPPVQKIEAEAPRSLAPADAMAWLAQISGFDLGRLQRALGHGGLYVDNRRCDAPPALAAGVTVKLYVFVREPDVVTIDRGDILHEDEHWVVVDKPAWLPVQGTRASQRISLETQLRALTGCAWASPVHRLDRQTSGVNLFAKTPEAFEHAAQQFRRRTAYKRYVARVGQLPLGERWSVRAYQVRAPHPSHAFFRCSAERLDGAQEGVTEFRVRDRAAGLLEAYPQTGRTHQIRLHAALATGPIVGDTLYGEPWRPGTPERVLLHAEALTLVDRAGARVRFVAPLPEAFDPSVDTPGVGAHLKGGG